VPWHRERRGEKGPRTRLANGEQEIARACANREEFVQGGSVSEDTQEDDQPSLSPCPSLRLWEPGDRQKLRPVALRRCLSAALPFSESIASIRSESALQLQLL